MAQRILGLDIGSWSIKAMVVESSLRRSTFVAWREHHIPHDATGQSLPGELEAALASTLSGLDADHQVAEVSPAQLLTREIELPFSDPKRIEQVLDFQLESVIPRPLDTLITDYQLLEKKDGGARLLCASHDKAALRSWIGTLERGGVTPRTLTLGATALENVLPHLKVATEVGDAPLALVDLGHRTTTVTLFQHGRMVAYRTVARGGHQLTQALARELDIGYSDAEGIKHRAVTIDPEEMATQTDARVRRYSRIVADAAASLLRDLRMTLDALAQRTGSPAALVLFGGGAALLGIDTVIAQETGLPVSHAEVSGPTWGPEVMSAGDVATHGLLAAALALEPLTADDRHRINLRKGEFAFGSDYDAIRSRIGWMVGFAVLVLIAHFVRLSVHIGELSKQEALLGERLGEHLDRIGEADFGADLPVAERFAMALELISVPPEDESRQIYPGMTAFHAFYETTRIQHEVNEGQLPDDLFDDDGKIVANRPPVAELKQVELQSFNTDGKNITITGTGFDIDVIEAFKSKLAEVPCFKQVERQETRSTGNRERPNWRDFTLKAELRCDQPASGERTAGARTEERP